MEDENTGRVRIFVGGLGESVSSDELRKIFSHLGVVETVEIIATKGRRFGYLDFVPTTRKALAYLFSTYNGCVWRGGRLRLEKANDHYLTRLKREWAQDALPPAPTPPLPPPRYSRTTHLRIFFPALRKVKALPLTGTGKHKYSFRRVQVPPLATHFCDCELHSSPFPVAPQQKPMAIGDGMNEEELHLMNSVMNKLLYDRENHESTNATKSIDDPTSDEDNLVINVVNQRIKKPLFPDQESRSKKGKSSKYKSTQDVLVDKRTRKTSTILKNAKPVLDLESIASEYMSAHPRRKGSSLPHSNESQACLGAQFIEPKSVVKQSIPNHLWSQKSSSRKLVGDVDCSLFNTSHKFLDYTSDKGDQFKPENVADVTSDKNNNFSGHKNQKEELVRSKMEGLAHVQHTGQDSASNTSGRGSAWLQKSSWTQLIGGDNSPSFSITHILPGVSFEKQEPAKPDGMEAPSSTDNKQHDVGDKCRNKSTEKDSRDFLVRKNGKVQSTLEMGRPIVVGDIETSASVVEGKGKPAARQVCTRDVVFSETCSFMRSAASLKDWTHTKAALNGSCKRRRNDE